MAIIYTYPRKSTAEAGDLVVISDSSDSNKTKQLTLQSIADYIDGEVTLQEVLNTGSRALNQGNNWSGIFRLDDTNPVGSNPQFIVDMNATSGSGSSVVYIVGKLETAIGSDAAFGNDIAVANSASISGNLSVNGTSTLNGNVNLNAATTELQFQGSAGTSQQVMISNGPGATPSWVDPETLPAGNVEFEVQLIEPVVLGDPLYIDTNVGGTVRVGKADASDTNKMPAAGIAKEAGGLNDIIPMIEVGTLSGNFLPSGSTGDTLYVASGGGLTTTRPTSVDDLVQNAGIITRQDGVNDRMQVTCIGRTNDTPNIISNTKRFEVTDDRGASNVTFGAESFNSATSGEQNVAVGFDAGAAVTTTNNNVMIGFSAAGGSNIGSDNVVIGHQAGTTITSLGANLNTIVGKSAGTQLTTGVNNVFVGGLSGNGTGNGNGSQNVILGANSTSDGSDSIVIGPALSATGATSAEANKMIVIGSQITAENGAGVLPSNTGTSITIGAGNSGATKLSNLAQNGILLGSSSVSGRGLTTNADGSVGIGADVLVDSELGVSVGLNARIFPNAENSVAIGPNSTVNTDSEDSIAIGSLPVADGPKAIAIGNLAETQAGFDNQIVIGTSAHTENGNNNIAIGFNASARANLQGSSLALMPNSVATRQYAMAIGTNTDATQENAIALGTNGQATNYANQINIRNSANGSLPVIAATTGGLPPGVIRAGDVYVIQVDNTQLGGPGGIVNLLAIV